MIIQGKLTSLRAPELADVPDLHRWSNDPEIWNMLGGWHFPYSTRSTEDWVKSRKDNNLVEHVFCIDTPNEGIIGTANIISIDWKNKNAFHGMMIGEANLRGKGYGIDALMVIMRYAFMELGLNRLDTEIINYNARSLKFYLGKGGWKQEGVRRDWFYRNGQYYDKVLIGVTRQNYLELIDRDNYWD
jgi:RimJ/RimL family protein N-acetyltransferase